MAEIQQLTATNADVRLVSLTVDPRSDTPPVLAKWGARFGADTNRWCFLTGSKTVLHGLIAKSFLVQDNSDPFNSMLAISPAPSASRSWTGMGGREFISTACAMKRRPPSWRKLKN